ncbi:MAG: hypothetical protein ACJAQ7_001000 [Sediminicola sp.]
MCQQRNKANGIQNEVTDKNIKTKNTSSIDSP